jgi:exopolyphosphatase/guanosine-5'-triphosphate,3'-diphosphate pyrophosphatase
VRCACIDIGSNTTRLLVAEPVGPGGPLREVTSQRVFTRIGAACGPDGAIAGAKLTEVAEVVAGQVALARAAGAEYVRAVATAAIRAAPNGQELCATVHARSGVGVDVLPGEEEARLAFLGATATIVSSNGDPVAVVDVGGGSTEIVVGTVGGPVEWVVSLPVGSGVIGTAARSGEPLPAAAVLDLMDEARAAFAGVAPPSVARAIAVGGSATSVRLLVGDVMDRVSIERALMLLTGAAGPAVAVELGLHPDRVRVLPAGLAILAAASDVLGARPLEIGGGGLREGVVLDALRGPSGAPPAAG